MSHLSGRSVRHFLERITCWEKSVHPLNHVALFSSSPGAERSKEGEELPFVSTPCWWLDESQLTLPSFTVSRFQSPWGTADLRSCDSAGLQPLTGTVEASSSGLKSYQVLSLCRVQMAVVKLVSPHPLPSSKSKTYAFCQLYPLETLTHRTSILKCRKWGQTGTHP